MSAYIENVIVSDKFLLGVKEALGYPIVDNEVINSIYTDDNIKDIVIANALEKFYNYFPIVNEINFDISAQTELSVNAPENTLGIIQYTFVDSIAKSNANLISGNPFYTQSQLSSSNSMRSGYGTPFNYNNSIFSSYQQNFYNNAVSNMSKMYYVKYNDLQNTFDMKSNTSGCFNIRVGCYSENVDDIPKRLKTTFQSLCRAFLKIKFASTLLMMNSDLPLEFDRDTILDEGKEELEEIEEYMIENSTIPLMR